MAYFSSLCTSLPDYVSSIRCVTTVTIIHFVAVVIWYDAAAAPQHLFEVWYAFFFPDITCPHNESVCSLACLRWETDLQIAFIYHFCVWKFKRMLLPLRPLLAPILKAICEISLHIFLCANLFFSILYVGYIFAYYGVIKKNFNPEREFQISTISGLSWEDLLVLYKKTSLGPLWEDNFWSSVRKLLVREDFFGLL